MAQRPSSTWIDRTAAVCTALLLALGSPSSVLAAPPGPSKTVQVLIAAAQKQVDAGNLERGAELFLEIWRLDRTAHAALYNAARLFQLAGNLDKSELLWRELLAEPGLPADAREKALVKLADVQQRRAERRSDEAGRAENNGQYGIAADLWADAVAMDPARTDWQRRWGRALHLAGKHTQAATVYDGYLRHPAATGPERAQVQAWRAELAAKAEPPPVVHAPPVREFPNPPPLQVPDQPEPTERRPVPETPVVAQAPPRHAPSMAPPPGWVQTAAPVAPEAETTGPKVLTSVSLGIALAGGVLLWLAGQDKQRLDEATWGATKAGRSIDLTHAEATSQADDIALRRSVGVGMAGGGGVLALIGAVWWGVRAGSPPVHVSAGLRPDGARLTAQVAW